MSYSSLLVNTVTVERPTVTKVKGVQTKGYATVSTLTSCNIQYLSFGGMGAGSGAGVGATEHGYETVQSWFGAFEYETDIQKDDKITDELGRVFIVTAAPLDVVGRKHHIECALSIQEET